jgi:maltooligosyltrehalose synthase
MTMQRRPAVAEVTDLMRVAQYVKSDRDAPSDVYNAACRMLDQPDEAELLRDEVRTLQGDLEDFNTANRAWCQRTTQAEAAIERVKAFAAELRTYCSPAGIAAVYADSLETVIKGAESNGDGRTPQTLGTGEGQEAGEAQGSPDAAARADAVRWASDLAAASLTAYRTKYPEEPTL